MEYYNAFQVHLGAIKRYSPKTVKAYLADIKRFRVWLDKNAESALPPSWEDVTDRHIRGYLAYLSLPERDGVAVKPASATYLRRIVSSLST